MTHKLFALLMVVLAAGVSATPVVPTPGHLLGSVRGASSPAAFAVLPDDSVLVLDATTNQLVRLRSQRAPEVFSIQGGEFDATSAQLVDLDVTPEGKVLLLDAGAGTLWVTTTKGRVLRRAGVFHTPVELGRAGGGMVTVWDPGVASVTVFSRSLEPVAHLEGRGLSARTAPGGRLARLDFRGSEVDVLLAAPVTGPGWSKSPARKAATLKLPFHRALVDATLLGSHSGRILLHVLSAPQGSNRPDRSAVWSVALDGKASREEVRLPNPGGECLDCGVRLRLGRDGRLALHHVEEGVHKFVRFTPEGGVR